MFNVLLGSVTFGEKLEVAEGTQRLAERLLDSLFVCTSEPFLHYMVKTNIDMSPRKRVRGITINEGGSNPLKRGRQEPPTGGFYAAVHTVLADTPLAAPSGPTNSVDVTPGTDAQDQSDAPGTDSPTYGAIV
uniref:Integrase core domain containing protein n=1 Tax=Solanum tuberosum TaxID=4113 RepID=M1E1C0_SOLTU